MNGKRFLRVKVAAAITLEKWYEISVVVQDPALKSYLDGELKMEYIADHPLQGFVGLWTRADQ